MFFKTAFAVRDLSPIIHHFNFLFCKCIVHFFSFTVRLIDNTESISAQQTPSRGRFAAYSSPHFNLIHRTFHTRNTGRFALKYCIQNIAKIRSRMRFFSFKPAPKRHFRANFAIFYCPAKNFSTTFIIFKKVGTLFANSSARTKQGQRKRRARNKKRLKL